MTFPFLQVMPEADVSKVQSTPEKKRVTWKPNIKEVRSTELADSSDRNEESPVNSFLRCNLIKECDNLLGPSEQADACLESLQNPSADLWQVSECSETSIVSNGPESMTRGDELAMPESEVSPVPPPAIVAAQTELVQESVSGGGLSEEEKHAGMKRRYSMLQQNLKLPAEEERRLRRERLRNLVPVWSKKRAEGPCQDV